MPGPDSGQTSGAERRFVSGAMRQPMLEAGHEADLARRWTDARDERALHDLVSAHVRLVVSAARRFRHYGLPVADLMQEGSLGLLQAAERFEPARGVRFSTYAGWWVRAAIQDFVLRNWSIVRIGSTAAQKSLFFNLRRLRRQLDAGGDETGLAREAANAIATKLGVSVRAVDSMAQRLSGIDRSLNAPLSQQPGEAAAGEWQDLLPDPRPLPDAVVEQTRDGARRRAWLKRGLACLDARQLRILRERTMAEQPTTLEDLGRSLGISKERVRQIESAALQRLRKVLKHDALAPR